MPVNADDFEGITLIRDLGSEIVRGVPCSSAQPEQTSTFATERDREFMCPFPNASD